MRNSINSDDALNTIRLSIRHPNYKGDFWILVEGESDVRLLRKIFIANVEIQQIPGGVNEVEKALIIMNSETINCIAIRDSDFSTILGKKTKIDRLFYTDKHDFEMMVIYNDVSMQSLVSEFYPEKIGEYLNIRNEIFGLLKKYSYIKLYNQKNDTRINFRCFPFGRYYNKEKNSIEIGNVINELNLRSNNKREELTIEKIENIEKEYNGIDVFELCNGHDFLKIFCLYVNGGKNKSVNSDSITSCLRTSYSILFFMETELYHQIISYGKSINYQFINE